MTIYKATFFIKNEYSQGIYAETSFFTKKLTEDEMTKEVYQYDEEADQHVDLNDGDEITDIVVKEIKRLDDLIA